MNFTFLPCFSADAECSQHLPILSFRTRSPLSSLQPLCWSGCGDVPYGAWACRAAEQSPPGEPGDSIPHPCTPPSLEVVLHVVLLFTLSLTQTSSEKPLTPQQGRGRSLQKRLHPAPKRTISITLFLFSLSFFLSLSPPPLSLFFFFPWTLKI